MAQSAAKVVDINSRPAISHVATGKDTGPMPSADIDEDDSSVSSDDSELDDLVAASSDSQRPKWKLGPDGNWQRYGSSESATSTSIMSAGSSIAADDKAQDSSEIAVASKKRMSDGTIKQPALIRLGSKAEFPRPPPIQAARANASKEQPQPKRRGRPPKDKSAASNAPAPKPRVRRASMISQLGGEVRPRSSIPSRLPVAEFASQCLDAAHASRLDPFALHQGEHELLVDRLMAKEITVYLNIRNAILRLWHQNPLCSITPEEAAGCAKESRFLGLAEVAYKWLVRNGYINFGCVEVPRDEVGIARSKRNGKQRTVVVIGAGVSGLTAARQLEHLFAQDSAKWTDNGERPPKVIVLEGRSRVGGRVYSKPLRSQVKESLPGNLRNTAEMGAMIVTGFEHGNPLDTIIRGQLGLRYHLMKDALTIYDVDGKAVDEEEDMLNTELYTDISDRTGEFRARAQRAQTAKGDEELITRCRDPAPDGFEHFQVEPLFDPIDKQRKPAARRGRRRNAPPGTEKITGRSRIVEDSNATQSAARAAKAMGWELKDGVAKNQSISLHKIANASAHPTLGATMDNAIRQYQELIDIGPQDMRLLNWHHANLEYANAAPVSSLSLSGHDQDTGNEFEGAHSEIVGGYTQVPRGLMNLPTKLDVRFDRVIDSIHYSQDAFSDSEYSTKIVCTDGEVIQADEVVLTAPLGVLKSDMIDFDPPLPSWKQSAINRMGFGLLNKVVLLYDKPFWDDERDMFGLLNHAEHEASLNPADYAKRRGRFYLIWNASKISGRPMLVALMAGNAAHYAETTDTNTLLEEVTGRLRTVFEPGSVPPPLEVIVTRWKRDPFTRGTYSYVGPQTRPGDYDIMAESVGNLHFAGEATCGTHPATVHGAFLSGLRVASDVMESMVGPINLPAPLVGALPIKSEVSGLQYSTSTATQSYPAPATSTARNGGMAAPAQATVPSASAEPTIKQEPDTIAVASVPPPAYSAPPPQPAQRPHGPPSRSVCAGDASFWAQYASDGADLDYEARLVGAILSQIGDKPTKPARPGVNPFLLFTNDKWNECKAQSAASGTNSGGFGNVAGHNAIRTTLGKWWRAASDEVKAPYIEKGRAAQREADVQRREYDRRLAEWEAEAARIEGEFVRANPRPAGKGSGALGVSRRGTNTSSNVVLDHL